MAEQAVAHEKRLAILLHPPIQREIAALAKEHKLSQSEIIEVMVEAIKDVPDMTERFTKRRESKVGGRSGKTAILKKLSKLSAEELEALAAQLKVKDE